LKVEQRGIFFEGCQEHSRTPSAPLEVVKRDLTKRALAPVAAMNILTAEMKLDNARWPDISYRRQRRVLST
jgi:hypothetical protein